MKYEVHFHRLHDARYWRSWQAIMKELRDIDELERQLLSIRTSRKRTRDVLTMAEAAGHGGP
jgi:hypothetical protein